MSTPITNWHLRPMRADDIPHAEVIRQAVGWNQTLADWQRLLALAPSGCFVAEVEGTVVGTVTTTSYGSRLGWIGMLLVHPDWRRQGIGGALLKQAVQHLDRAGMQCIALDATPAGQPLYASAGFVPVWELARWQGASSQLPDSQLDGETRQPGYAAGVEVTIGIPDGLWPAIVDLERRAFGVERTELLRALSAQSNRVAVTMEPAGQILGFGMVRGGARAQMLGPLAAVNAASAAALLAALGTELSGELLYWDIPAANRAAVRLADSLGFTRQRTLTRMAYGEPYPTHAPTLLYAIADLATG